MKKLNELLILLLCCFLFASIAGSQTTSTDNKNQWQSIIGEVLYIDQTAGKAAITTADKKEIKFEIDKKAVFLRVKPNEKNLENAAKISLSEINKGSKILARGLYSNDGVFTAQMIIVVSNAETVAGENSQNESVQGIVTAVDPVKKQIKANINSQTGVKELNLDVSASQVGFYRYSDKSLKFNNSVVSSIDKIKVGDQLKAVGKMSADGLMFLPQTLVSGTFRTVGGKIVSINAQTREISIEDFQSKKLISVAVSQESLSRILDSKKAEELIDTYFKKSESSKERKDLRSFVETLPLIPFEQITAGDSVIISATVNNETSMTAFYILKDVKPIFSYLEKLQQRGKPLPNLGGLNL
ncbi:MAG: hypothetical protein WA584_13450 [Pyrinomonadaceae bacterium]